MGWHMRSPYLVEGLGQDRQTYAAFSHLCGSRERVNARVEG